MLLRIKNFKTFLKDPNKKDWFTMFKEVSSYAIAKKKIPLDYFRKFLYRKGVTNCNQYLIMRQQMGTTNAPQMLFSEVYSILRSKLLFGFYCEKYQLPVPKIISYNLKNKFFFEKKPIQITTKEALLSFFTEIFETSGKDKLFLKYIEKYGGLEAILLKKEQLEDQVASNADMLLNNSYIHQEVLIQHPDINIIHGGSVNPIRIDTYMNPQGKVHILSTLMRFGIGKTITDNTSTGGFSVGIDHKKGSLKSTGRSDMDKGGLVFTQHPNSAVVLEGYKVPYYQETCEMAINAVRYFPNPIIEWDIAIGKNEPYIIEGNEKPSLHMTDIAFGGYCNHPMIQEILLKLKL